MNIRDFVITGFDSILYVKDKKGQTVCFENRYASCFIVTKSGKITFTSDKGYVISQKGNPVFIPEGFSYTNECNEDAESFVFNFHTAENAKEMQSLSDISINAVQSCYDSIKKSVSDGGESSFISVFKELYTLAECLFADDKMLTDGEKTVSDAVKYMAENFHDRNLTVKKIAEKCYVSEIYLRKLFERHKKTTPFKMLTDIRMNHACKMCLQKRPVKEIALSTGYSDIYQFSRAYKRYFGYPPSYS